MDNVLPQTELLRSLNSLHQQYLGRTAYLVASGDGGAL